MILAVPFVGWEPEYSISGHPRNDISLSILHQASASFLAPENTRTPIGPILSTGTKSLFLVRGNLELPTSGAIKFFAINQSTNTPLSLFQLNIVGNAVTIDTSSEAWPGFLVWGGNSASSEFFLYFSLEASTLNNTVLEMLPNIPITINSYTVYSSSRLPFSTLAAAAAIPPLPYKNIKKC